MKTIGILIIIAALALIGWASLHHFNVTNGQCESAEGLKEAAARQEQELEDAKAQKKPESEISDKETKLFYNAQNARVRAAVCEGSRTQDKLQLILGAVLFIVGIIIFIMFRRKKAAA
jgi:hypothetical protein